MIRGLLENIFRHFTRLDGIYVLIVAYITRQLWKWNQALPLPPGPKRLPFVGNIGNTVTRYEGPHFAAYGDKYGARILQALSAPDI